MEITEAMIRHIEALSRLDLSEAERASLGADLRRILAYVAQLDELDTASVLATTHVLESAQPLREDESRPSMTPSEALAGAPRSDGASYLVPPVIGAEEDLDHA